MTAGRDTEPDQRSRGHWKGLTRRYWLAVAALLVVWVIAATLLAPRLIAAAYEGRAFGPFNALITGQSQHPVDYYLDLWSRWLPRLTLALLAIAAALYGVLLAGSGGRFRALRELAVRSLGPFHPLRPHETLLLCVSLGIVIGIIEATSLTVQQSVLHKIILAPLDGPQIVWLGPLAGGTAFLVLGLLWLLIGLILRRWIRLTTLEATGAVFGFLGFYFALPAIWPRIHPWAALVLTIGLTTAIVRLLRRNPERTRERMVRRAAGWAGLATALAIGASLTVPLAERSRLAGLPEAHAGAPNVLLIILDTVRAQNLSLHGYERPTTRRLERFAAEGTVFDLAVSTASWTLPSHASVFTGLPSQQLSTSWYTPLDDTHPTLAERLAVRGYRTAGFSANVGYVTNQAGLGRGFSRFDAAPQTPEAAVMANRLTMTAYRTMLFGSGSLHTPLTRTAAEIAAEFRSWLRRDRERPFFAFLNLFDAHEPYVPPPGHQRRFSRPGDRADLNDVNRSYTDEEVTQLQNTYDEMLLYLDEQLDLLFEQLDRDGYLDDTVVIITSDHGEEFREHGMLGHGGSLYLPSLHVPLIIRFPGSVPADRRISAAVSIADLPATILDLVDPAGPAEMPGRSLRRLWSSDDVRPTEPSQAALSGLGNTEAAQTQAPTWQPIHRGDMHSALAAGLHYIRDGAGDEELYDVITDPWETEDLVEMGEHADRLAQLRAAVDRVSPRSLAAGDTSSLTGANRRRPSPR